MYTVQLMTWLFFSFSSSLKNYTSLCKVSICDQSEDITSYAPGFVSRL